MSMRNISIAIISILMGLCLTVASNAEDRVSDDGKTVSHDAANDPPFEWTLERMLMATPMPMTQEGRDFLRKHKNLDEIRQWNEAQFNEYVSSSYGKQHSAEEAWRWRDLTQMLKSELPLSRDSKERPLPNLTERKTVGNIDWNNLSVDDIRSILETNQKKLVFEQMKHWRQQIADLAPKVEAIRKKDAANGMSEN